MALSAQLGMHLAGTVDAEVVGMHRADLGKEIPVTHHTRRLGLLGAQVGSYRGRSDLGGRIAQCRTDRIDSVFIAVSRDELHDQRCGRSISAAKKAEACFKIVFARRSSRFSRSNAAMRSASSLVVPGRTPPSISA